MTSEIRLKVADRDPVEQWRADRATDDALLSELSQSEPFTRAMDSVAGTRRRAMRHLSRMMVETQRIVASYDHADRSIDRRLERVSEDLRELWRLLDGCMAAEARDIAIEAAKAAPLASRKSA